MNDLLEAIWFFIQFGIGYNLFLPLLMYILYQLFRNKQIQPARSSSGSYDYAVIVTAYQYTNTLEATVKSLLNADYANFLIYVVADNCDTSGLSFNHEKVILLQPEEVLAGNVRSHFYAIRNFKRKHDLLTVIDSDNLVDPDYFKALNKFFDRGFEAVQGIRKAKNLDSVYACLDAARDIYYHFYDAEVLFRLGSSATLSGSGMAFTCSLFKSCLQHKEIAGAGFDKVLQAEIVGRNLRIAFAPGAVVYDQKTSYPDELVKQRSRWIYTWLRYFKAGFKLIAIGTGNGSINQLLFGLVLLRPPLFIFLILSAVFFFAGLLIFPAGAWFAGTGLLCFAAAFLIALSKSGTDIRIYKSLTGIPKFVFYQLMALLAVVKRKKGSVSTRHH